MDKIDILNASLTAKFPVESIVKWRFRCRPRILILVDGLNYRENDGFGLWRFLHAITVAPGVTNKPTLTLAHRTSHPTATVIVGPDTYTVQNNFNFATATPAVTVSNYDQVWIFGIGSGAFSLSAQEVGVISEFMNSGGGFFATGDHASLGRALCGSLPRVRRMREWRDAASGGVPMGTEADANLAINRIDTVVDPGSNGLHEFDDQSDNIPQRIYPNYKVTDTDAGAGSAWQATAHPLLMLPGAATTRSSSDPAPNGGFANDIDVLPDHPHESVCYEVNSPAILGGTYNVLGQNFPEFQPSAANPAQRVGVEIVAYAVSGGRSVLNGVWKPPVRPRMFGVISAYDGRLAQAYSGKTQRPGRIVCDSTWHHYVNINLDGTGSGRTGLGTGSGMSFTPSPELEKIYAYYRNIVGWLQPANRIWCSIFWDLVAIRFHPTIFEELIDIDRLIGWRDIVGVGREAKRLIVQVYGREALRDQVSGLLTADARTQLAGDLVMSHFLALAPLEVEELMDGIYGALLIEIARLLPDESDTATAQTVLEEGPARHMKALQQRVIDALQLGARQQSARLEGSLGLVKKLSSVR